MIITDRIIKKKHKMSNKIKLLFRIFLLAALRKRKKRSLMMSLRMPLR